MMSKRFTKVLAVGVFLTALLIPVMAFAAETTGTAVAWQEAVGKALAAGLAMGLSALGAAYAQAKIGSAGAGTLAERPEVAIWVITLQALPEVIVLLGFVSAIMIKG
jgi:V/A-type H+/Na+-transporting ATPase subunit K